MIKNVLSRLLLPDLNPSLVNLVRWNLVSMVAGLHIWGKPKPYLTLHTISCSSPSLPVSPPSSSRN